MGPGFKGAFVFLALMAGMFLWGCGTLHGTLSEGKVPAGTLSAAKTPNEKNEIILPEFTISPGMVILLQLEDLERDKGPIDQLLCDGNSIPFYIYQDKVRGILSESYFSSKNTYACYFRRKSPAGPLPDSPAAMIKVIPFDFPREFLKVAKKTVFLSKKNLKKVAKEQEILNALYKSSPPERLFNEGFAPPLDAVITSRYGTKRIYNKSKKSQHLGTDFRAKVGVPVRVSNAGKVVFSGHLFFTGHTIIVDHGLSIFTVYAHLSRIKVRQGQMVPKNKVIGLSGQTGRVSGPHLHWGVKIGGNWVDGFSLVKLPF